jgi:catechol 2,3-dioxygenase-like lactoylglutathione lyase family enzyme
MAEMRRFYGEVLGLEMLSERDGGRIVFFRIAEGYGGHTAVLALFQPGAQPAETGETSSLHHIALTVPEEEQHAAIHWLEAQGLPVRVEDFPWIGWRGVFTRDPDGNTVELVAGVPSLREGSA